MKQKDIVLKYGFTNYMKAKKINDSEVLLVKDYVYNNNFCNYYYKIGKYEVVERTRNGVLLSHYCDCANFNNSSGCEHIVKLIMVKNNFKEDENVIEDISSIITNDLLNDTKLTYLQVFLDFNFLENYVSIKPKIGTNKLYALRSKFKAFFEHYKNNSVFNVALSKNMIFDKKKDGFIGKDKIIIDYLLELYQSKKEMFISDSKALNINYREFEYIIKLIENETFSVNGKYKCNGITYGNPYNIKIYKENEKYYFKVDFESALNLCDDFSFAYKDRLYKLPSDIKNICNKLNEYSIDTLILNEETAIKLSKKLYTNIKNTLIVNEDISDKFIIKEPSVKLYFDLFDKITCKVMFNYGEYKEVNYFSKPELFRNEVFEENIINELFNYKFRIDKKKLIISNIDDMVDLLEKGIFDLSDKYEVLTSKKFSNADIVNTSIKSSFTIGKDNIMKFDFDLGDISNDELKNVFNNVTDKKKYYKLKNGNILKLDDTSLLNLKDVYDNLEIDYKEESGIIPKYRALYLDSVKDYDFIKTNNLFKDFISNFNKYKDNEFNFSDADKAVLRDYQYTGVKWLYNIYKCGFGGILADEMGLGKTIQSIVFLKQVLKEKSDAKILIVAPTSLIYNWSAEFDKFGSELKYTIVSDNKEKRKKLINDDSNIYITTYGLLRQDEDLYKDISFEVTIIDEGQNIKNPNAGISRALKHINSNVRFSLTGTPVENSVLEVWSIFDFIMPGYLNSLNNFQSKYNKKNIEELKDKLTLLNSLISPFILRRRKKEVLLSLPDKINNDIYLDLLPEQKKLYAATVKQSKERFDEIVKNESFLKARFEILTLLTKLRQICIDPSIIYDNCDDCSVKMKEIISIVNGYIKNNHKVLIFSSFKSGLSILKSKLDENKISNYSIDGSVSSKKRNELVNAFNKDNTNVFLIMLKAGGTGLNLTSADIVIHLDLWWNPQAENQATDRAHRIGQTNKVEVVRLICSGTIEEKIISLQDKKKLLNDCLIDNNNDINISSLNEEDIKDLLSYSE